jgi:Peptidase family M50
MGRTRIATGPLAVLLLLAVVVALLCVAMVPRWMMPGVVGFVTSAVIGVIVHEAGHALCASLVRVPVQRYVVGQGPLTFRHRINGVMVECRAIPLGGAIYCDTSNASRRELAFVLIGGVLGNVALILLVAGLAGLGVVSESNPALKTFVGWEFLSILVNLFPWATRRGPERVETDGMQLLKLYWPGLRWKCVCNKSHQSRSSVVRPTIQPGPDKLVSPYAIDRSADLGRILEFRKLNRPEPPREP